MYFQNNNSLFVLTFPNRNTNPFNTAGFNTRFPHCYFILACSSAFKREMNNNAFFCNLCTFSSSQEKLFCASNESLLFPPEV